MMDEKERFMEIVEKNVYSSYPLSLSIVDIMKGQPEVVLRKILQGRSSQCGNCSLTIQFRSNLLSFLNEEEEEKSLAETFTEGKNSWYADIKTLILKSPSVSRTMGLDSLRNEVEDLRT